MWSAIYLPKDEETSGFYTKQEAIDWVRNNFSCESCRSLKEWDDACLASWGFCLTEEYIKCESFRDVMMACFELVDKKC